MSSKKPKHKQPTFNANVAAAKKAVVATNPDGYLDENPTWRVGMLELCAPYGWHEINLKAVQSIQERLRALESMTWREILFPANTSTRQHHYMPVSKLCAEAQDRLEIIAPDVDEVMSIRISQKERVWGIMDQEICQLIFWDPDHELYEMNVANN